VALNPATPLTALKYLLPQIDLVLLMMVDAGLVGQKFIPEMIKKIRELKKMIRNSQLDVKIEVDGAMNAVTIPEVVAAGADILVLGTSSGLYDKKRSKEVVLKEIRRLVKKGG